MGMDKTILPVEKEGHRTEPGVRLAILANRDVHLLSQSDFKSNVLRPDAKKEILCND